MHPRAAEFRERATDRFDVDVTVHEFDEGTKTAEDAAAAVGCDVAKIASGLVFMADGDPIMVITSGANRVSEDRLAGYLDADDVAMADPELVREVTGYGIGGVAPFCHESTIDVLIDPALVDLETVWAAAGTPAAIFPIDPTTLIEAAEATPAAVTE